MQITVGLRIEPCGNQRITEALLEWKILQSNKFNIPGLKKKKKKGLNKADWCKLANTIAEVMVMLSDETQNKKKHYHDAWGWRPETTLI